MFNGQSFLYAFLTAIPVAIGVAWVRWRMPEIKITPFFVFLGNFFVIVVASPIIGLEHSVFLFFLFAFAAIPVSAEYYISAWYARQRRERIRRDRF